MAPKPQAPNIKQKSKSKKKESLGDDKEEENDSIRRIPLTINNKPITVRPGSKYLPPHPVLMNYHTAAAIKLYKSDVTFVTFTSPDRISTIIMTLENWNGPVHMAYYIRTPSDLPFLDKIISESRKFRDRVTVHLVWSTPDEPFPINMLRNVAQSYVRTTHVFHCDIDFVPSKRMRERLVTRHLDLLQQSQSTKMMFVIPALEQTTPYKEVQTLNTLPFEVYDAKSWLNTGKLRAFHYKCVACQSPTNIEKWLVKNLPYRIDAKVEKYEPFVIIATDSIPWNENFTGYGRDKTLYYFELFHLQQYETIVLPDTFIIHRDHGRSSDADKFRKKSKEYAKGRLAFYDRQKEKLLVKYYDNGILPQEYERPIRKYIASTRKGVVGIDDYRALEDIGLFWSVILFLSVTTIGTLLLKYRKPKLFTKLRTD